MFPSGYCSGLGIGGWLIMIGFWGLLLAVVVWAVMRLFPTSSKQADRDTAISDASAGDDRTTPAATAAARNPR